MSDATRLGLADGADLLGLSAEQLWWRYAGLGGVLEPDRMQALIAGREDGTLLEVDLIAQAMNEAFLDAGVHTFPIRYSGRAGHVAAANCGAPGFRTRRAAAMVRAQHLQLRSAALVAESERLATRMAVRRSRSTTIAGVRETRRFGGNLTAR